MKRDSFTKNEKKFEQWLLQQYGMTNKEQREYTLKGNLESLWEIFSAADMVLFARGLPSIGKELAQLGKKAVDDVAEEAIEKTVKKETAEEMTDTAEDLSQKTVNEFVKGNYDKVKDNYLKRKGIDAHELKKDFLGRKAPIAQYDIYVNKNTGELFIFKKGGKGGGIPTGEFIK